ncbi:MAG: nucleotide exchange factor GrpE [Saprospiraceae bacterium]|nr:nucleotide exchange factor GrpE [Saprospiraceae bacterium]
MASEEIKEQESNTEEQERSDKTVEYAEFEALQQELSDVRDKYLRLLAEFDNFKKRTAKERLESSRFASQDTMAALLPVLDDFDRAKQSAEDESTAESFSEGVNLVYHKLKKILESKGLEAFEPTGEDFDPELHEAVTEVPAPSKKMKGKIVDTIEKGYRLNDKIIRYAKVVVGK